jgi:hypothetical protein
MLAWRNDMAMTTITTTTQLSPLSPPCQVQNFGLKFTIFGEFRFYRPDPVKAQTGENISVFFEKKNQPNIVGPAQ